ncbi:MAG: hypothetical protein JWM07_504 [Candidatus Saccharibacteria bacterium]|nr:hypothetical protein [Candidatus Saccharibacteria bacterium]
MNITRKNIVVGSVLALLAVMVIIFFSLPKGSVEFAIAPSEVSLKINNKTQIIKHKQIIKLTPGTYEAEFSSADFESETKTIVVENRKKNRIVIALTPLTDAARKKINDNSESVAVVKEYKSIRYNGLLATLPLSGVNYMITSCASVKNPGSDTKALCVTTNTQAGKVAAVSAIKQLGYDPNDLEILIGSETQKVILESATYRVDYYTNVKQEGSDKVGLFVTPLNVPFVSYTAPFNQQLEAIKAEALNTLEKNGYNLAKYDVFYSNIYLSKYNPNIKQTDEHAMPPNN